ncbi:hypothetical protein HC766_01215 [Candidatus Gracilibacteria bacterium]|nr:hypothetical protein [Candidatus Gracilibacteria bacterium]
MAAKSKIGFLNEIHKKLVVLYGSDFDRMKKIWKQVRSDYKEDVGSRLPLSLRKNPEKYEMFVSWVDNKIKEADREDLYYLNKADLMDRSWSEKIIQKLYPKPDYKMYLGRGRYAYYYNGTKIGELEDTEEFIDYITKKLHKKKSKPKKKDGFGEEFIFNL